MAREELEKEILTLEKIKLDYKQQFLQEALRDLFITLLVVFLLLLCGFAIHFISILNLSNYTIIIFLALLSGLAGYLVLSGTLKNIHSYFMIKNTNFTVTTDVLLSRNLSTVHPGRTPKSVRSFIFEKSKTFYLDDKFYNTFSDRFRMYEQEFYDSSSEGDVFYIIAKKNKQILLLYNTKFFEYRPF